MDNSSLDMNDQGDKMIHRSSNINIILISNLRIHGREEAKPRKIISFIQAMWSTILYFCIMLDTDAKWRKDVKSYELRKKNTWESLVIDTH